MEHVLYWATQVIPIALATLWGAWAGKQYGYHKGLEDADAGYQDAFHDGYAKATREMMRETARLHGVTIQNNEE